MPIASSIQELIDALRDRETNITKALDDLFGNQAALQKLDGHPQRPNLDPTTGNTFGDHAGDPLPSWVRDELKGQGWSGLVTETHALTDDEIVHIQNWDPGAKATLQGILHTIIPNGPPLKFYWELHAKNQEETDFSVPNQVISRSPQQNLSFSGWLKFLVNTKVKVGP